MKGILSKEDFVKYMNFYKEEADAISKLYHDFGIDIIEMKWYHSPDLFEKLLSFIMEDEDIEHFGTNISWWCWETDFGRDKDRTTIIHPDEDLEEVIDTPEKLYDLLVQDIANRLKKENKGDTNSNGE